MYYKSPEQIFVLLMKKKKNKYRTKKGFVFSTLKLQVDIRKTLEKTKLYEIFPRGSGVFNFKTLLCFKSVMSFF